MSQQHLQLKGTIVKIFDSEIYGSFEKRIFWLEESGERWPSTWAIEMHQGDCKKLDDFLVGDTISCQIKVFGRKWDKDGKSGVINTLKCTSIQSN